MLNKLSGGYTTHLQPIHKQKQISKQDCGTRQKSPVLYKQRLSENKRASVGVGPVLPSQENVIVWATPFIYI